jgi:hypothetical protein
LGHITAIPVIRKALTGGLWFKTSPSKTEKSKPSIVLHACDLSHLGRRGRKMVV